MKENNLSDVLVTIDEQGDVFTCFQCLLFEDNSTFCAEFPEEMIKHLQQHLIAGHKVPPSVFRALRDFEYEDSKEPA